MFIVCIIPFVVALIVMVSFAVMMSSSSEEKPEGHIAYQILGVFYLLFSASPLNERGKKWRRVFLVSLVLLAVSIAAFRGYRLCE